MTWRDAVFMVIGMAILVGARIGVEVWRRRRPTRPPAMFLDLTSRERRQMLYHDGEN